MNPIIIAQVGQSIDRAGIEDIFRENEGRRMRTVKANEDKALTVTTVGGTVYKLSRPDALGYRAVRRLMAKREKGGSVIIKSAQEEGRSRDAQPAHKTFFKGRVTEDLQENKALSIEIFGEERTLISEPVAKIEIDK